MKKLFVTHVDLDGIYPLILNRFYGIVYYKEVSTNYGDKGEHEYLKTLLKDDGVLYVDFTPDDEARAIIEKNGIKCTIIDHHESQKEAIDTWKYPHEYVYNVDKSGALLYYEYLIGTCGYKPSDIARQAVTIVSTYDLWKENSPIWDVAQNLNRLLWRLPNWSYKDTDNIAMHSYFISGQLWKLQNLQEYSFNRMEMEKINADIKSEMDLLHEFTSGKRVIKTRKDNEGKYFAIIKLNKKVSIICNLLLKFYKKLDYIICINTYDENNPKISIRSKDSINLLEYEGVGGHEHAGGFPSDDDHICEKIWNGDIYCLVKKTL